MTRGTQSANKANPVCAGLICPRFPSQRPQVPELCLIGDVRGRPAEMKED